MLAFIIHDSKPLEESLFIKFHKFQEFTCTLRSSNMAQVTLTWPQHAFGKLSQCIWLWVWGSRSVKIAPRRNIYRTGTFAQPSARLCGYSHDKEKHLSVTFLFFFSTTASGLLSGWTSWIHMGPSVEGGGRGGRAAGKCGGVQQRVKETHAHNSPSLGLGVTCLQFLAVHTFPSTP